MKKNVYKTTTAKRLCLRQRMLAVTALALITAGGVFMSCNKGAKEPFTGTWTGADISAGSSIVFTGTTWALYSGTNVNGTYTYNGNSATLTNSDGGIFTASISGNTLTIVRAGLSFTFTKSN